MKVRAVHSHQGGVELLKRRRLCEWATEIFSTPKVSVKEKSTKAIRDYVKLKLELDGWALSPEIDAAVRLTVFARKEDVAFQLQTGNISRYAYDVLKLQYLHMSCKIRCAVLAVPSKDAATKIGSNHANFERIRTELNVFDKILSVPMMVIAFE